MVNVSLPLIGLSISFCICRVGGYPICLGLSDFYIYGAPTLQ